MLIEDYLYPKIITKKTKIDKLLSIKQDIESINKELITIKKEAKVYIDTGYNYMKAQNVVYIIIQIDVENKYTATLKEILDIGEKYVHMNDVPQGKTCDVYNELLSKLPIRDRIYDLYNRKLKLDNDILDIKKDLKIVC